MTANLQNILSIISYFIIYSFLGWILESVYKSFYAKKLVNSGFLHGPFCPIYGFGAIVMTICFRPLKGNILYIFVLGFIILTIWEYLVAVFLEKVFKTKYWDYSYNKFNIQGRICLKNSTYWAILAVIFTKWIHPFMVESVGKISNEIVIYSTIILTITMIADAIATVIRVVQMDKNLKAIVEIGDNIKGKIEELTNLMKEQAEKNANLEHMQEMIKILKRKQARMKIRIYRQARRLKKAFPTIQSESITEILNQTIDIKSLKNKIKNKEK